MNFYFANICMLPESYFTNLNKIELLKKYKKPSLSSSESPVQFSYYPVQLLYGT